MTKSTICVSACLMAGWCLLLPVYHCIGVFCHFRDLLSTVLFFYTSSTSHTCSSFFASFFPSASYSFCLLLLLPPSPSPPVLPLHPLPQVVQDLLPLIFQLRRWFLRCPNCSSLCFQHETRRRSWDLRHTTSRSAETMKWRAVQLRKLTLWLLNRVEFSHLTSSKLC